MEPVIWPGRAKELRLPKMFAPSRTMWPRSGPDAEAGRKQLPKPFERRPHEVEERNDHEHDGNGECHDQPASEHEGPRSVRHVPVGSIRRRSRPTLLDLTRFSEGGRRRGRNALVDFRGFG